MYLHTIIYDYDYDEMIDKKQTQVEASRRRSMPFRSTTIMRTYSYVLGTVLQVNTYSITQYCIPSDDTIRHPSCHLVRICCEKFSDTRLSRAEPSRAAPRVRRESATTHDRALKKNSAATRTLTQSSDAPSLLHSSHFYRSRRSFSPDFTTICIRFTIRKSCRDTVIAHSSARRAVPPTIRLF